MPVSNPPSHQLDSRAAGLYSFLVAQSRRLPVRTVIALNDEHGPLLVASDGCSLGSVDDVGADPDLDGRFPEPPAAPGNSTQDVVLTGQWHTWCL
jgi:hypothetical protein